MCADQPDHDGDRMNPSPRPLRQAVIRAASTTHVVPSTVIECIGGSALYGRFGSVEIGSVVVRNPRSVPMAFTLGPPLEGCVGEVTPGKLLPVQTAFGELNSQVIPSGVTKYTIGIDGPPVFGNSIVYSAAFTDEYLERSGKLGGSALAAQAVIVPVITIPDATAIVLLSIVVLSVRMYLELLDGIYIVCVSIPLTDQYVEVVQRRSRH